MAPLKKIMSWLLPVKVGVYKGTLSPVLEVTYENGVKVLNAGRVNYSFGALHDVFRIAFRKARVEKLRPANVLILGFGAGSIARIIRDEYGMNCPITGVEADEGVIKIGREHFETTGISSCSVVHARAEEFIEVNHEKFDLVAVDIFVEEIVPEACRTEKFLQQLKDSLTENGIVVFNEMPQEGLSGESVFEKRFRKIFPLSEIHAVKAGEEPNRIYVGRR